MESVNKNNPSTKRNQERLGKLYAQRGGSIRDFKARSINVEEVNFQDEEVSTGLLAQIVSGKIVDGSGNFISGYIELETLGGPVLVNGNIAPSINNFYKSGVSTQAWAGVYAYAFPAPSDARIKNTIENIKYGLDTVNKLRPVSFKYNDTENTRLGFVAQEIKEHLPEVVDGSEEDQYSLSYDEVIPVLVKAVQELSAEVAELKKKLESK